MLLSQILLSYGRRRRTIESHNFGSMSLTRSHGPLGFTNRQVLATIGWSLVFIVVENIISIEGFGAIFGKHSLPLWKHVVGIVGFCRIDIMFLRFAWFGLAWRFLHGSPAVRVAGAEFISLILMFAGMAMVAPKAYGFYLIGPFWQWLIIYKIAGSLIVSGLVYVVLSSPFGSRLLGPDPRIPPVLDNAGQA